MMMATLGPATLKLASQAFRRTNESLAADSFLGQVSGGLQLVKFAATSATVKGMPTLQLAKGGPQTTCVQAC